MNKFLTAAAVSSLALSVGCGPSGGTPVQTPVPTPSPFCPDAVKTVLDEGAALVNDAYTHPGVTYTDCSWQDDIDAYPEDPFVLAGFEVDYTYDYVDLPYGWTNNVIASVGVSYTDNAGSPEGLAFWSETVHSTNPAEDAFTSNGAPEESDLTPTQVLDCMTYLADQINWCDPRP